VPLGNTGQDLHALLAKLDAKHANLQLIVLFAKINITSMELSALLLPTLIVELPSPWEFAELASILITMML
jgi:hypothetical protein